MQRPEALMNSADKETPEFVLRDNGGPSGGSRRRKWLERELALAVSDLMREQRESEPPVKTEYNETKLADYRAHIERSKSMTL